MKFTLFILSLIATGFVLAPTASAEPPSMGGACADFIKANCEGQHPRECLANNKAKLPKACAEETGKHESRRKELEQACGDTMATCKAEGPGPGMFECLEKKGSSACKEKLSKMKQHRRGPRP